MQRERRTPHSGTTRHAHAYGMRISDPLIAIWTGINHKNASIGSGGDKNKRRSQLGQSLRTSVSLHPPRPPPPLRPPHTTMTPLYCMYGQPVRDSSADLDRSSQPRKEDIRREVNEFELATYFFGLNWKYHTKPTSALFSGSCDHSSVSQRETHYDLLKIPIGKKWLITNSFCLRTVKKTAILVTILK